MMAAVRRVPVVVVLGATGTGKSKLAIELGRHFNGEIISADSMQLYRGLDVITNKVTATEQAACPHHLLSVLDPLSDNNTVTRFRAMALPIVEQLLHDGKMPIIVGGTNYYIEALLWNFLIDQQTADLARLTPSAHAAADPQVHGGKESGAAPAMPQLQPAPFSSLAEPPALQDSASPSSGTMADPPALQDTASPLWEGPGTADMGDRESASHSSSAASDSEGGGDGMEEGREAQGQGHGGASAARRAKEGRYADVTVEQLYSQLQTVDPDTAAVLHHRNRRKIVRALQVYDSYGVPMSGILAAQHAEGGTPGRSGALRFPHTCILWIQSQQTVLDERLDRRVDAMLASGLVAELHELHQLYLHSVRQRQGKPDYTLGIFQSIGFKEFHDYLILPEEKRDMPEGTELLEKGVEGLKLATRQYARRQLKWIKNRFLKRGGDQVPAVYALDSTDPSVWDATVLGPAVEVVTAVAVGREVGVEPLNPDMWPSVVHVRNVCEVCGGRTFTTLQDWNSHLGGRSHRKRLQRQRKREAAERGQQTATEDTRGDAES